MPTQMINTVPRVRTISEPWSFNHLHSHYLTGKIKYSELRRLLKSALRLQCKRDRSTEIDHICVRVQHSVPICFIKCIANSQVVSMGHVNRIEIDV